MGYNSASYIHTVYQAMSLAFADRDFYYGDPAFPPEEPIEGLLSKDYAKQRAALVSPSRGERRRRSGPATRIRSRAARIRTRTCCDKRAARRAGLRRGAIRRRDRSCHRLLLRAARRP